MEARELPPTRRALHRAPGARTATDAALLRARSVITSARAVAPSRAAGRHAGTGRVQARRGVLMVGRVSQQAIAAATAAAFVAGAVGAVSLDTAGRQEAQALAAAEANQARVDRAATVRLTAAAAQYAKVREAQALAAAQAALEEARTVLVQARAVVGDETVIPLDEAAAELAALLETAAPAALSESALPTTPGAGDPAATAIPTAATSVTASDATSAAAPAGTTAVEPTGAPPATPTDEAVSGAARPDRADGPAVEGDAYPGVIPDDEAVEPALRALGLPTDALDLEVSARMLAVAEEVAALSTQFKLIADDLSHELALAEEAAAARRAEEEARRLAAEQAALEAALRRLSTRIRATDAAPNGAIPIQLLCRPRFTNVLLRCDAARALEQLNDAYRAAFGHNLAVTDGYRTYAQQEAARANKGDLAAEPGTSNHGRALAVDFSGFGGVGQFDDPDYLWMVANAGQFGWVHPPGMGPGGSGPLEPWHWEFGNL